MSIIFYTLAVPLLATAYVLFVQFGPGSVKQPSNQELLEEIRKLKRTG